MMKELEIKNKDEVVISKQKEQKYEKKYIGTIKPYKGHTLFKMNVGTGEISKAKFEVMEYEVGGVNKLRVIIEPGYTYASALNKKNALKKFNK